MRPGALARLRRDGLVLAVLVAVYLAVSGLVTNSYYQLMLTLVPVWAAVGLSWNLFSGYVGLISFGHAVFFGLGAYTVALTLNWWDLSPWLGIALGTVVGAAAAVFIGMPTFRLRGHYFALSMLAFPLVLLYLFQYLGYQEVSLPMKRQDPVFWLQFTDPRSYTLIAVGLVVVAMAISMAVENSRFGLTLMAIRQNELAAEASGIDARRWKMRALVLSGAIAAAAGGFYACILLVVTPDAVFGMLTSAQALTVVLFGGVGTVWGPLIGSAILIPLAETLHAELGNIVPGIQGVVYGVAIILVMLLAPEGVFWTVRDRWRLGRGGPERPAPRGLERSEPRGPERGAGPPPAPARAAAAAPAPAPLLRVEGLSKAFGGLRAVDDVSFAVASGEILGIIGPNGAGKTTLFNVLNGVLPADAGRAWLDGETITGRKLHAIRRLGVGRTFQVVRSFPRLSLLDNVLIGAYGAGLTGGAATAAAEEALERVGLLHDAARSAGQLTNKGLRLMELARALAGRPRLLLLDETLAGLGREECDELLEVLRRLRAEGTTIVIIEHTMHAMLRLADRFVVLDHGKVLAEGAPQAVVEDRSVIEAYLGKKWLARCST
ncbi:branched-chain amino acid ABC transporter ATP-binding protein/permease [Caldovatus aquaticus]|uniref:Branched-chain amino acid ABC transporter ATP-binding protein/permease n=1 Tax=Caldovatus aquaticus TaxID=2865671 RepID=A0ABS7F3U0_9PROT|nr:branched-chain amino acid ABC transporter ATP-binding protein/permease [Caldovatus aquaticus]MBW8269470.1 branched-chain amino acid ABC transporter ATP-binding protein/permease [Caldovatus aquaticus]